MSSLRLRARRCSFAGLVVVAAASTTATGAAAVGRVATVAPVNEIVLSSSGDGALVWDGAADGAPIELRSGPELDMGWDLRGLDASQYRSDLVQFRLDDVDGPGRVVATTTSPFGGDEPLADSDRDGDGFVLQVGRTGATRWHFERPGAYRVSLTATIPTVTDGTATATAIYDIAVDAPTDATRLAEARSPRTAIADAVTDAVTTAPRVVTSDPVTYTVLVGNADAPGGRLVLDVGHTDAIAPTLVDGELVIQTKDDTQLHDPGIVYRDPEELIFQVLPSAEMPIPTSPAFGFLGTAGDPVWMLPMAQNPALLWPGWSTEHPSLADQFDDIEFEVTTVDGPGDFHLFLTDTFGNPIHRANNLGNLSNTWTERVPAHVHANWAFTRPGTYQITVQVSGTWLNAPDNPTDTTTTTTTTGSTSTTTPAAGSGDDTITTTTTQAGANGTATTTTTTRADGGTGTGGGGGSLANAGAEHLGPTVAIAVVLLAAGTVLVRARRIGRPTPTPDA